MLDLIGALGERVGLAQRTVLCPPGEFPLWLFGVDVGLADARRAVGGAATPFDLVGAYGWTRPDAMTRAIGEAVERFSLIAQPGNDPLLVDAPGSEVAAATVRELSRYGLLGPTAPADGLQWVAVHEPQSDHGRSEHRVPSVLVTDPVVAQAWSDGTPSGAASGPSRAFAVERALLESIERDAAVCCWALRPRTPFADTLDLVARTGALSPDDQSAVAEYLVRHRARAHSLVVPTDGGVSVALTFVDGVEEGVPVLATGARAGTSTADCVSASLREAIQVHGSLLPLLSVPRPAPVGSSAVDEETRAWACLSSVALDHYASWLERAGVVDAASVPLGTTGRHSGGDFVTTLRARGLRPLLADLTPRLPAELRTAGWSSVRAIVLGHQQYRMDDTKAWSWYPPRLDDWARRLVDPLPFDPDALAHTLI